MGGGEGSRRAADRLVGDLAEDGVAVLAAELLERTREGPEVLARPVPEAFLQEPCLETLLLARQLQRGNLARGGGGKGKAGETRKQQAAARGQDPT